MNKEETIDQLEKMRSTLASAQTISVESYYCDKYRVKRLYEAIEEALDCTKILQDDIDITEDSLSSYKKKMGDWALRKLRSE